MATYRFEQFNVEISNPSIEVVNVTDNLQSKTCSVGILLTTDSASFGVNLTGFVYSETWEDSDVEAWVSNELQKYEV